MPTYSVHAIVLHRHNLGENDRILTLFTREQGKISAVAKGARKPTSKLSGATEPFTALRALLSTGKSLEIISQCEILHAFSGLRVDLDRIARASYFCELLERMTPERDDLNAEELFELTLDALRALQSQEASLDIVVHAYELRLLSAQGYAPELQTCVRCGEEIGRGLTGFSPALGGVLCSADRYRAEDAVALSGEALQILQTLLYSESVDLTQFQPSQKASAEMARALRWFIRARAEREIKSAEFLDQLRASQ